ncbi:hypothetical protein ACFYUV_50905 [Nonomuraea sp. NPDC003560]|uniref:Lsr2 family DNA-binding protein n=1 Tax=Nonomuraea sp. NPDC003560 TaxID=3364341 RepID=UPI003691CAD2
MTDKVETLPSERLRRLTQMSVLERNVHVTQWADELLSRHHGRSATPSFFQAPQRDTVAAVLLSLVDDQASVSDDAEAEDGDLPSDSADEVDDEPLSTSRSNDVPAAVIRAWAQQNGISVNERGRLPMWVTHRYHTENVAQKPEQSLANKIRQALEQHGPLTKSALWNSVGRNHASWVMDKALESMPDVQISRGESNGGRSPVIFRLVEVEANDRDKLAAATGNPEIGIENLEDVDDIPTRAEGFSRPDMADSKIDDLLQILRGESNSG